MSYTIAKIDRPPQPVLVIRRSVPQSGIGAAIAEVLPRVFQFMGAHGIAPAGAPVCRYVDMGPEPMTIEPGVPIAAAVTAGDPEIQCATLPGDALAYTLHAGPYDRLGEAHAALQDWMAAEGLEPAGGPWESYINDPGEHPDPKDWKTEVFWPVRPK